VLAFTSNAAFNNQKTLQVFWAGVKIAATPDLDLLGPTTATSRKASPPAPTPVAPAPEQRLQRHRKCRLAGGRLSLCQALRWLPRHFYTGVQDGLANGFLNKSHPHHDHRYPLQILEPARRATEHSGPRKRARASGRALAESSGYVVFRETVTRVGEHPVGITDLDQVPEMEVRGALRHACRLLHRVRDDHDRIRPAQLIDPDPRCAPWQRDRARSMARP